MSAENMPLAGCAIESRGLKKSFGEHHALAGVDLKVATNERLVIFGPNGAGKTTLLKVLATLMKPSSGTLLFDGVDSRSDTSRLRRRLSLVSHETFLYNELTLYENLKFYAKMYGVIDMEKRISEVTAWVQLEERLHDRVGTLSRGLQQRASFARAILHKPSILFLDEPDIGLDPRAGAILEDIVGSSFPENRTVVMTTHNLERGLELGTSIVILNRGKVVYGVSCSEVKREDIRRIYDRYTGTVR